MIARQGGHSKLFQGGVAQVFRMWYLAGVWGHPPRKILGKRNFNSCYTYSNLVHVVATICMGMPSAKTFIASYRCDYIGKQEAACMGTE